MADTDLTAQPILPQTAEQQPNPLPAPPLASAPAQPRAAAPAPTRFEDLVVSTIATVAENAQPAPPDAMDSSVMTATSAPAAARAEAVARALRPTVDGMAPPALPEQTVPMPVPAEVGATVQSVLSDLTAAEIEQRAATADVAEVEHLQAAEQGRRGGARKSAVEALNARRAALGG